MSEKATKTAKKKGLSINKKERQMLSILGVAAIGVGFYFGIDSLLATNSRLKAENDQIQAELSTKLGRIQTKNTLENQLATLNLDALVKAKKYYGKTNQGEFIYLIDKLIVDSGIKLLSVSFAETTSLDFVEAEVEPTKPIETSTIGQDANANQSSSSESSSSSSSDSSSSENASSSDSSTETPAAPAVPEKPEDKYKNTNITQMTAKIDFKGNYEEILKLLELVDKNDRKIVSSELVLNHGDGVKETAAGEEKDSEMDGTVLLRFYQVADVARYVPAPESNVDKSAIPFAAVHSPFMRQSWGVSTGKTSGTGSANNTAGNGLASGTTATSSTVTQLASQTQFTPSYFETIRNSSNQSSGLSAFFNTSTVYRFESNLELIQIGSGQKTEVTVDNGDFKEGNGSNVVTVPGANGVSLFEMPFPEPMVTLNNEPTNISFAMFSPGNWRGEVGLIVQNAQGEKLYLKILSPIDWAGWREVSFSPANISGLTYPMKVMGYYFETPSGSSDSITFKLDNLAVHYLVTN